MARKVSHFNKFVVANFVLGSRYVIDALKFEIERYHGSPISEKELKKILKYEVFDKELVKDVAFKMYSPRVAAHFVGLKRRKK